MYLSSAKKEALRCQALNNDKPAILQKTYHKKQVNEWRNEERDTLLCLAVMSDAHACAQTLKNDGADPLVKGHCGETPFSYAMRHESAARLFTILHAEKHLTDAREETVRHLCHTALEKESHMSICDLFEHGLPLNAKNVAQAFNVAMAHRRTDVMTDLLSMAEAAELPVIARPDLREKCEAVYTEQHHPVRQWLYRYLPEQMAAIGQMPQTKTEMATQILPVSRQVRGATLGGQFNAKTAKGAPSAKMLNVPLMKKQKKTPLLKVRR